MTGRTNHGGSPGSARRVRQQKGVSLIELLIGMAISLVVAAALASIFAETVKSREQVNRVAQKLENGRYALDVLTEDIRLAGYFGEYLLPPDVAWTAPAPCDLVIANLGWNVAGKNAPLPVFGYNAHAGALPAAVTACLPDYLAGTDVLVVRRTSTASFAPDATQANETYFQASSCPTQLRTAPYVLATRANADGDVDFPLMGVNCLAAERAPARKYMVRIYYVGDCNRCDGSADDVPGLKVADYVGGAWAVRSIAGGVEDMHFEFGRDTDGDGAVDSYDPSSNGPAAAAPFPWQDVMSIRTHLLVRDLAPTPNYDDPKTYNLGGYAITIPAATPDRAFKRRVFAAVARVTNSAGRRE